MSQNYSMLKSIPKIDIILNEPKIQTEIIISGRAVVVECARAITEKLRADILSEQLKEMPDLEQIIAEVIFLVKKKTKANLCPVINGTGIILHTNLGRALLCEQAAKAAYEIAKSYSTLEYDCVKGERGSRYSHISGLLTQLCGCESAIVVNNNAAAVLLILSSLAKDKEVIVSRGELVEIGGSFRIPEIISQSNAFLVEVGTTNKTHLKDYANAINPDKTAALLKVHTSNYKILGFTDEVSLQELVELGKKEDIPVIHDLGSGAFINTQDYGLEYEPNIIDSIKSGADVVCFSGDKLFGGPQAGIIAGKKEYIDKMKVNPLARAVRVDKMTLAALEATLRIYLEPNEAVKQIPTLRMLTFSLSDLRKKAEILFDLLTDNKKISVTIIEQEGQVGGGSMPAQILPSVCIAVTSNELSLDTIDERLRNCELPIIGRIHKSQYLLDVRCVDELNFSYIAESFNKIFDLSWR